MARHQVKKVVTVCFLEATKLTMDHLGQHRMELSQRGSNGPKDLAAQYGDLRRLRDYLQRCISAFPDVVDLDLGPGDQALLVASCRRAVEALDARIEGLPPLTAQERDWLQRKRQVLSDWAVELAVRPLVELPLPRMGSGGTQGVKALNARIQHRVSGGLSLGHGDAATATPGSLLRGSGGGLGEPVSPDPAAKAAVPRGEASTQPSAPPIGCPIGLGPVEPFPPAPAEPAAAGFGAGFARMDVDPAMLADTRAAIVDVRRIRDPRLRALMALDVRAYERAVGGQDHRLAAVHLSSILEGAILDHAMPRRAELGLGAAPETWNPQEVLLRILGDGCTPKDRSLLYHVFAARNLIRPTVQLTSPTVVTAASLEKLAEFVQRAMREMGFQARPQAEVSGLDVPSRPPGYGVPGSDCR